MTAANTLIIELDRFSGPMDLLLYLIRKEEMDIFDINIHHITKQYLESVKMMKKLDLELAGDFVAMAATLIQIKAKMLLPQYNEAGEEVVNEDPRKDLVRRLVEYQMYKDAGKRLYERPLLGRDVFGRGHKEIITAIPGELIMEEDNALYALISSYRMVVRKLERAVHKVARSLKSIKERILEIKFHLQVGKRVVMSSLMGENEQDPVGTKLITFLSLLELAKLGLVSLFQSENYADIHVEAQKEITEEALSKVESYESVENQAAAALEALPMTDESAIAGGESEPEPQSEAATDEEILAEERLAGEVAEDFASPEAVALLDRFDIDAVLQSLTEDKVSEAQLEEVEEKPRDAEL